MSPYRSGQMSQRSQDSGVALCLFCSGHQDVTKIGWRQMKHCTGLCHIYSVRHNMMRLRPKAFLNILLWMGSPGRPPWPKTGEKDRQSARWLPSRLLQTWNGSQVKSRCQTERVLYLYLSLSLYLSSSMSFFGSGIVSSSLWSNVSKVTSL